MTQPEDVTNPLPVNVELRYRVMDVLAKLDILVSRSTTLVPALAKLRTEN